MLTSQISLSCYQHDRCPHVLTVRVLTVLPRTVTLIMLAAYSGISYFAAGPCGKLVTPDTEWPINIPTQQPHDTLLHRCTDKSTSVRETYSITRAQLPMERHLSTFVLMGSTRAFGARRTGFLILEHTQMKSTGSIHHVWVARIKHCSYMNYFLTQPLPPLHAKPYPRPSHQWKVSPASLSHHLAGLPHLNVKCETLQIPSQSNTSA